jgi:formylglycine-generating enzyme required for sulfatase activity
MEALVEALYDQCNDAGENALALFLRVVSEKKGAGDACQRALVTLANELEATLAGPIPKQPARVVETVDEVLTPREEPRVEQEAKAGRSRVEVPEEGVPRAEREPEPEALPKVLTPREDFEPEMVLISAGPFLMGSDLQKDKQAYVDEKHQHKVELPAYYIARTPVTNAQYAAFVRATGHEAPKHWDGDQPPRDKRDHPVVHVSWNDVMAYCAWLREVTGRAYTLPSEAEWEKAARGPDGWIYPWGDAWDAGKCNSDEGGKGGTTPVGAYPQGASPYGVLDMAGNVWEWTRSLMRYYPYIPDDGREDVEASRERVVRGGSFYHFRNNARCAYRCWHYDGLASVALDDFGFRVCVSPSRSAL